VGGQAAASSRIENYLGFPNGVSGEQLVENAATQAQRLGARLTSPAEVVGLRTVDDLKVIDLLDGTEIASRAVVIASGARYRRLEVEHLERFEGAGVYYATTELETLACAGQHVIVVGGGNSAGQAALFLAKSCASVALVVRRDNLSETMSHYLTARIDRDPRIRFMPSTVVRALDGNDFVESAVVENTATDEFETLPCRGVFCFIGAVAATDWLGGAVALDRRGFVLTSRDLPADAVASADFAGRDPLPFETSMPGVFAVGDVRAASRKRVAAAVGEGSSVVSSILDVVGTRL
jgi:thioredoxin reductase (NADPH)